MNIEDKLSAWGHEERTGQLMVRMDLVELLTSPISHWKKVTLLHLYNQRPHRNRDIWQPIGMTRTVWNRKILHWVDNVRLDRFSYFTGLGTRPPNSATYPLLDAVLYRPIHPATRLVILYAYCRAGIPGWKWSRADILKQLGISMHTWRSHVRKELLAEGYLIYGGTPTCTRIRLALPTSTQSYAGTPISSPIKVKYNNITPPGSSKSSDTSSSLLKLAHAVGIKGLAIWRYVKKFTKTVVKEKLERLKNTISRIAIHSPRGWLWNACLYNWDDNFRAPSFSPDSSAPSLQPSRGCVPNERETQAILDKIYQPPTSSSAAEEEMAKVLADNARAALRDWCTRQERSAPTIPANKRSGRSSIPSLKDILGLSLTTMLGLTPNTA